ncbi:hypothetical protein NXS98_07285 [Fontisphaera persica]|uniref:hypothetical protein n=1 Tax=Fontisphaera persica TaxID=2974023 RepID=UPI0024BF45F9|nr:hypothetical protein [Fontisphaera persica]WCJ60915.1 hypothetical protein NXS98_07285 [Fontisphaera persica]
MANDLGIGSKGVEEQKVGLDHVSEDKVRKVADDLAVNPPLAFDLARQVRVFNCQVEFVESPPGKIQLQRQEVKIPQN